MSRKRKNSRRGPLRDGSADATPELVIRAHSRWPMRILWIVLLVVVIGFVVTALPQTKLGGYQLSRAERRRIAEAERMERDGLPRAAAGVYGQMAEAKRISDQGRSLACERLADLNADKLNDPRRAVEFIEKALFHANRKEDRERLGRRVDELRKRFEARLNPPEDPFKNTDSGPPIAEIGERKIALEELMFAWARQGKPGEESLDDQKLHEFTVSYLNDALYAEEARRRGLDRKVGYKYETRLQSQKLLAQAIMTEAMPDMTDEALKIYYEGHKSELMKPGHVRLGHIVVADQEAGAEVSRRLAAGEAFEAVGEALSLDAGSLDGHVEIGFVSENENFIPYVGAIEGLARRLTKYDDGATTGPIASPRGFHYFKVMEKRAPEPEVFDKVKDQLARRLRVEQSRAAQEALLKQLRERIPTKIHEDALKTAMQVYRQKEAMSAASSGAKPAGKRLGPAQPAAPQPPGPTPPATATPGDGA